MITEDQLKELPKVELHCHLLGVITPKLLHQLQAANDYRLVPVEPLARLLPVRDTTAFREVLQLLAPYQKASWIDYQPILTYHIQQLIAQQVVYTEIMISPLMFPQTTAQMIEAFRAFRQWVDKLEQERIQVEFLMVMPRWLNSDQISRNMHQYIELSRVGLICGVAIVGLEDGTSLQRFTYALKQCKKAGLGIEIHAGEHSGSENVWDAVNYGLADRIGHGIGLFQDVRLVEYIRSKQIHLEFCPTSNLCTGSVTNLSQHPLPIARQLGLSYSVNTDDPGFFNCTLTDEYRLLAHYFDFSQQDFNRLFETSIQARFRKQLKYIAQDP